MSEDAALVSARVGGHTGAMHDGRVVWDSETGPVDDEPPADKTPPAGDGVVRVRREVGGRGGKTVTTIAGIQASAPEVAAIGKKLKKLCGVGGSVTDFVIELQGDQRERAAEFLRKQGYQVKLAGG